MSTANPLELGMLALINDERAAAGLEPLQLITLLNDAAETHSAWMLETNVFSHSGDDGSSPTDRMEDAGYSFEGASLALENIGWQSARGEEGFVDDVTQVHASLMNSPGHRANILNPDAEDIGIGIETGTFSSGNGDFEAVMVTQVFGTTDADISAFVDTGVSDDDVEIVDDTIAQEDEDETDTPIVPEAVDPETDGPVDNGDDPIVVVDDDVPVVVVDDDTPVVTEDTPEAPADDDWPEIDPEAGMPPEVITIEDVPLDCALTTLTVDLSDVFEFNSDGEQITLETTQEQLVTAFQNAIDDWTFMMEAANENEEADISDLMIDGMSDDASDGFSCGLFEEEDEEELALQCV